MQRPLFTAESHGIVTKGAWKDEWITGWIERQFKENKAGVGLLLNGSLDMSCIVTTINDEANCVVPKYIPARMQMAPATTRIPKVIWQTWKSRHVGASAYKALNTWITYNPEYEYIFFEDQDVEEFMCTFAPTYSTIVAYDLLRFGACRADIWRVLVTERYGGIYIDSDSG
jgi:mannosyltransferase OCH1-like enzyme